MLHALTDPDHYAVNKNVALVPLLETDSLRTHLALHGEQITSAVDEA